MSEEGTKNKNLVLIMGKANSGKTTALMSLPNPEKAVYFNADGKETPFKNNFLKDMPIDDPYDLLMYIDEIEANPEVNLVILDTITFLMNTFRRTYITDPSITNTQEGWAKYTDFYERMIHKMKLGTKDYAILAHQATRLNTEEMEMDTVVPLQGAVGKRGAEGDFTTIVSAKRMLIKDLEKWENDLLTFTEEELEDGFKNVFMTRVDAKTLSEKMRSAMNLWSRKEKYINNDISLIFKRLHEYYDN